MQGYHDNTTFHVRNHFTDLLLRDQFVIDKSGVKTIEIVGVSFIANEPFIFGAVNEDYVRRELEWYNSMSRNVKDIPGGTPAIWTAVSSKANLHYPEGTINSNYGWMMYSAENNFQYLNVLKELRLNPFSRRALAIYNRPTMHQDYKIDGMSDFVCTNAVQYLIRDGFLDVVVQMRSNDAWAGYRNDYAWQKHVQEILVRDLEADHEVLVPGTITWQVGSLHVYEKDFYLVHHYEHSGQTHITKAEYREKYPESPWI